MDIPVHSIPACASLPTTARCPFLLSGSHRTIRSQSRPATKPFAQPHRPERRRYPQPEPATSSLSWALPPVQSSARVSAALNLACASKIWPRRTAGKRCAEGTTINCPPRLCSPSADRTAAISSAALFKSMNSVVRGSAASAVLATMPSAHAAAYRTAEFLPSARTDVAAQRTKKEANLDSVNKGDRSEAT